MLHRVDTAPDGRLLITALHTLCFFDIHFTGLSANLSNVRLQCGVSGAQSGAAAAAEDSGLPGHNAVSLWTDVSKEAVVSVSSCNAFTQRHIRHIPEE